MKSREVALIVEDSPETLNMLTEALETAGIAVLVALDGAQALVLLERITPDIILMDAMLPGMDGFETTRQLKRHAATAHVPVIFMTGLSETEHILTGLEAGGVDYVTKPIVTSELIARMHVHMANARVVQGTQVALDAAGRYLLCVHRSGRILWCTPQAAKLLASVFPSFEAEGGVLLRGVQKWLKLCQNATVEAKAASMVLPTNALELKLYLQYLSQTGPGEFLLWLVEGEATAQEYILKQRLSLTLRQAEVLLWIARGKSNRDVGEILGLSPRTVNKHLEHIYKMMGVENRGSAVSIAVRLLSQLDSRGQ